MELKDLKSCSVPVRWESLEEKFAVLRHTCKTYIISSRNAELGFSLGAKILDLSGEKLMANSCDEFRSGMRNFGLKVHAGHYQLGTLACLSNFVI